jgi:quinol-cytochrome oxidoreductase complex cytochrome b subunit
MIIGAIIFFIYQKRYSKSKVQWNMKESTWLWLYVIGVTIISYLGNFGNGQGYIGTSSFSLLLLLCLICNYIAASQCLGGNDIAKRIDRAIAEDQIKMIRASA